MHPWEQTHILYVKDEKKKQQTNKQTKGSWIPIISVNMDMNVHCHKIHTYMEADVIRSTQIGERHISMQEENANDQSDRLTAASACIIISKCIKLYKTTESGSERDNQRDKHKAKTQMREEREAEEEKSFAPPSEKSLFHTIREEKTREMLNKC